ncbi:MAG: tol-pal system-associated acyl-CoA thioesterase [Pseudomonadota bacterium]
MTHEATFRVYYEDTDMAGVVYYANYLKFIERARSDALRQAGIDQRAMREEGLVFVVTRVEADYLVPARYEDLLRVVTETAEVKGASAVLRQTIWRAETLLFQSVVRFACMNVSGKPVRMPSETRVALAEI